MAQPSAVEQAMLEQINRARLDPAAEAARLGIDLNNDLAAGTISASAKSPLAFNTMLETAAALHSQDMLNRDYFDHVKDGVDPGDRITAAGYNWNSYGENIAVRGQSQALTASEIIRNATLSHDQLFLSAGHRTNLMSDNFREVGIGIETGQFTFQSGSALNSLMTTQNFGASASGRFLTGVAFADADGDGFYDAGEGRSGISVAVGAATTTTLNAGGYTLASVGNGELTVTFSGGTLDDTVNVTVAASSQNAKVDLIGNNTVTSSLSAVLGSGARGLTLLGVASINGAGNALDNIMTGGSGANQLSGGAGNDSLNGGAGSDTALFSGARSNYTVALLADGTVSVSDQREGADGTDTLLSIESFQFTDGLVSRDELLAGVTPTPGGGGGGVTELNSVRGTRGDDFLVGTAAADLINGLRGGDTLKGKGGDDTLNGGRGRDVLSGGSGSDTFYFSFAGMKHADRVTSFSSTDKIAIKAALLGDLAAGALDADAFHLKGAEGMDALDRVIYDSDSGRLYVDADGAGAAKAHLIAIFKAGAQISADDIFVV